MTTKILFAAPQDSWDAYRVPLTEALDATGVDYQLGRDIAAEEAEYVVYAPSSGLTDFTGFPKLKAVLSLWAGVEKIVGNDKLTVPLTRMVDDEGLTQGMVEYVTGHALRHHLGMDAHIVNPEHVWLNKAPPLARARPVTVLGLGMLGSACARQLAQIGFPVTGWSRTPREIEGIRCLSGAEGLAEALTGAQIVVLLLPFTPQTENTMGADEFALLAPGAAIINPGRGPLIDDAALLAALDAGQVGHATLDVFRVEPLPQDHPFWAHPKVTVTPHIAAETRVDSASRVIAENVRRGVTGEPLLHVVDRDAGY